MFALLLPRISFAPIKVCVVLTILLLFPESHMLHVHLHDAADDQCSSAQFTITVFNLLPFIRRHGTAVYCSTYSFPIITLESASTYLLALFISLSGCY